MSIPIDNASTVSYTLFMNTETETTRRINVRRLATVINAYENGKLSGRWAERGAAYAVKALEDAGVNVAAACRKYG